MTICRDYLMTANEAQVDQLKGALKILASQVKAVGGCEGVEFYQETKVPTRFHFLERWTSVDAHRAAGQLLGKEAFAPIMAAVAEPPASAYLEPVALAD